MCDKEELTDATMRVLQDQISNKKKYMNQTSRRNCNN